MPRPVTIEDRPPHPGKFGGSLTRMMLDAENGSQAAMLGEAVFEPGASVPLHKHNTEEAFYIIEGRGTALAGAHDSFPIKAGDALLAPAGELHGLINDSDAPLKLVYFYPQVAVDANYPTLDLIS